MTYRVRYRVKNAIGWSDYSEIEYIQAITVPGGHEKPILVSATATYLEIKFGLSFETGGSDILTHVVEYSNGINAYAQLLTYDESTTTQ